MLSPGVVTPCIAELLVFARLRAAAVPRLTWGVWGASVIGCVRLADELVPSTRRCDAAQRVHLRAANTVPVREYLRLGARLWQVPVAELAESRVDRGMTEIQRNANSARTRCAPRQFGLLKPFRDHAHNREAAFRNDL